ncbi:MAG: hypothetical protein ACE5H2_07935 [Terriglobia bacterium]
MLLAISLLFGMLVGFLGVSALLLVLLVYRIRIGMREQGQLLLDPSEAHFEREQRQMVRRLERLRPYLWRVFIVWLVMGLATFGLWVWQALY